MVGWSPGHLELSFLHVPMCHCRIQWNEHCDLAELVRPEALCILTSSPLAGTTLQAVQDCICSMAKWAISKSRFTFQRELPWISTSSSLHWSVDPDTVILHPEIEVPTLYPSIMLCSLLLTTCPGSPLKAVSLPTPLPGYQVGPCATRIKCTGTPL